jgi:hypothetical protein
MSAWIDQIFEAAAAQGNVVRRSIADIEKYANMGELVSEVRNRSFHLVLTGEQAVVICNVGELRIVC